MKEKEHINLLVNRKMRLIMQCKYCGFLNDDSNLETCSQCGKSLVEDDLVEETFEMSENDEDVIESEPEEDEIDENEESERNDVTLTSNHISSNVSKTTNKKNKTGLIVGIAAGAVVACVGAVYLATHLKDKSGSGIDEDYSKYISKMGTYKGVKVSLVPEEVTDTLVDQQIQADLQAHATNVEVKDRTDVQKGDTVNIDFTGYVDGKEFENGSAEGFDLVIGSGRFIEGFEDGLIGKKVGKTVKIKVTFPENYGEEKLNGKEATFKVKINSISQKVVPELTEDWIKENTSCKTIDEYRASTRKSLEEQAKNQAESEKSTRVIKEIYNNTEFSNYPEEELNLYTDRIRSQYEYLAATNGMSLEDYVVACGKSVEEYEKYVTDTAQYSTGVDVIMYHIANTENLSLSDKEYEEKAKELATNNYYESLEDCERDLGKETLYNKLLLQAKKDSDKEVEALTDEEYTEKGTAYAKEKKYDSLDACEIALGKDRIKKYIIVGMAEEYVVSKAVVEEASTTQE